MNLVSITIDALEQSVKLNLYVNVDFEEPKEIEEFMFTASEKDDSEGLFNHIDFLSSQHDIDSTER